MGKKWVLFAISAFMAFTINESVSRGLASPYSQSAVLALTVLFMLASAFIFKYPWHSAVFIGCGILLWAFAHWHGEKAVHLGDFIGWSVQYISGNERANGYVVPLSLLMYAGISLAMYALAVRFRLFYVAFAIGIGIFAVQWYGFVDRAYTYMLYFVAASLVYCAVFNYPFDNADIRVMGWGFMACAIVMGAVHYMPVKIQPVSWERLSQWVQDTFPVVRTWRGWNDTAGVGFTGFTEGAQWLGGPAVSDNGVALYVKTTADTLYLRGGVYDMYDGKRWAKSGERWVDVQDGFIPKAYSKGVKGRNITVDIMQGPWSTRVLFTVLQPVYVKTPGGAIESDEDLQLRYSRRVSSGFKYTFTAFQPDVDPNAMRAYTSMEVPDSMKRYLQLPDELPQRVKDLALKITEGYKTPFDKALAIEAYLRQYEYNLDVPSTPASRDFTDYFLFELKKGYCTYYASAMAVMLRCVGIPARYVTGFIYRASDSGESAQGGYKAVTDAAAHAWVEAYFPGYGWVNFEPTPFYLPLYYGRSYSAGGATPYGIANGYYSGYSHETFTPDYTQGTNNKGNETQKDSSGENKTYSGTSKSESDKLNKGPEWARGVAILTAGLFALVIFAVWAFRYRKKKPVVPLDPKQRALWQFEEVLAHLSSCGFKMYSGETILEFADRISKHLECEINFRDVAFAFNRVRYGREPQKVDVEMLDSFYQLIKTKNFNS
ncbi:transglutaminase family protein [Caldanaerobius polysaccharolyticus]|uniref:transglutaminase family protein n=1 Tax=Caldanaerobius polysaccharolyticus TaxID=44256 RepID=UPI000479ECC6|nr:DUF3488 and transglutaminase-like domain-containing protein [Caldanaerobius polysaccharolyticus]